MDGPYTQDWQEYEYEQHKEIIQNNLMSSKRKDREGCAQHNHIVFCKLSRFHCVEQMDPVELALKTKKLPTDVRRLIAKFYNWMYYRSQVPNSVLSKIIYVHSQLWTAFLVTHHNLAVQQLNICPLHYMRGYCPTCGEPCVSSKYFYWAWAQRKKLRTNSYTLTLMRVCASCRDCDFDFLNGQKVWNQKNIHAPIEWIRYPYKLV